MKYRRAVAVLAATFFMTTSPAFAATAVCTARDSTGKHWTDSNTNVLEFAAKVVASELAKGLCKDKSRHPHSCKILFCKVTK